jgi:hypothetical protein
MAKNNGVALATRKGKQQASRIGKVIAKATRGAVKKATGVAGGASKGGAGAPAAKGLKRVYFFGNGKAEGNASMKDLLGGKGANLADMTLVPLPVPAGFTITTDTCGDYNDAGGQFPAGLMDEVRLNVKKVEQASGKRFGDPANPLLVAARSGAKMSMPA